MADDLLRRIHKARQSEVKLDGHTFIISRPTDVDALTLYEDGSKHVDIARRFVIDWRDVTESDVVPKGSAKEIEFNAEIWSAWLDDTPEFWVPIGDAIIDAYSNHTLKREAASKNL